MSGDVTPYIVLSAILFTIGAVGFMLRRNAIVAFMCVELMLNASNLALVAFSHKNGALDGQIAAFFVMVVAAAEVVVGLGLIVAMSRRKLPLDVDRMTEAVAGRPDLGDEGQVLAEGQRIEAADRGMDR